MRWRLTGHDTTKTSLDNEFDLNDTKSVDEVLWGGLLKISYKLYHSNKISLNGIYNRNGESTSRILEGSYPYDIDPDWVFKSSALQYNERILKSIQLNGDHKTVFGARIEWRTSFSNSTQDEPDLRYFTHYISDEWVYGIKSNLTPERYFRFMEENRREATLDISIPFKQWKGRSSTFKFGGLYAAKSRDFSERLFKYQPVNGISKTFREVQGNVDLLFADENLGVIDTTVAPNGNQYYDFGITISEIDQKSNNYIGDQTISAFYSMLEIPIIANLRFIAGARYETTNMTVISQDTTKDIGRLDTKDILPAVNLIYSLFNNISLL